MSQRRACWALGAGFALSGIFLWLALRQVDLKSLVNAFVSIRLTPVILCACALALGMVFRAARWRTIAGAPRARHREFYRATNLGLLANMVLPGRLGELVRVFTLARLSGSGLARPMASAVIDRLVDVLILLACALALFLLLPIDEIVENWLLLLVAGSGIAIVTLTFFAKGSAGSRSFLSRIIQRLLRRLPLQPDIFLRELRSEFRHLLNGGWINLELALFILLIFGADYAAIAALHIAFNVPLSLEGPLLLWVFLAAGSALPSAPGYVGIYQAAAVLALSFFAVPPSTAVALATVLQMATLGVACALTGPSMLGLLRESLVAAKMARDRGPQ